jgi:hypothetical protein
MLLARWHGYFCAASAAIFILLLGILVQYSCGISSSDQLYSLRPIKAVIDWASELLEVMA